MRSSHSDDELFLGILDAVGSMSLENSEFEKLYKISLVDSICVPFPDPQLSASRGGSRGWLVNTWTIKETSGRGRCHQDQTPPSSHPYPAPGPKMFSPAKS